MRRAISAAAIGSCLAAPAAAAFYIRVETVEVGTDPSATTSSQPSCGGDVRLGGGFDTTAGASLTARAAITTQDSPGWATVMRNDGVAPAPFTGAVICSDAESEPTIAESSFPVTGGDIVSDLVSCPGDGVALNGGVAYTGFPGFSSTVLLSPIFPFDPGGSFLRQRADGSAPAPGGWEVVALGDDDMANVSATMFAVCLDRENVLTVVASGIADPDGVSSATVPCPAQTTAVGGGVDAEERVGLHLVGSGPVLFGLPLPTRITELSDGEAGAPTGWRVALRNDSFSARSFKAAAICVPEPGGTALGAAALAALATSRRGRRQTADPRVGS
jgi:hypothetical protein